MLIVWQISGGRVNLALCGVGARCLFMSGRSPVREIACCTGGKWLFMSGKSLMHDRGMKGCLLNHLVGSRMWLAEYKVGGCSQLGKVWWGAGGCLLNSLVGGGEEVPC